MHQSYYTFRIPIMTETFEKLRLNMVESQLKRRNIKSEAVLDAMRNVPRHLFVPKEVQDSAYDDCPLPIGLRQTISQPYIVAYMTEQLQPKAGISRRDPAGSSFPSGMKVLEIGTGSGYQAAILAHLGCDVFTIEFLEELYLRAQKTFIEHNFSSIKAKHGNGFLGWPENAPFDAIIVTAAPDKIPQKLLEQLKNGGKMIVPVGPVHSVQYLKLISKCDEKIIESDLLPVRFVPMVDNSP